MPALQVLPLLEEEETSSLVLLGEGRTKKCSRLRRKEMARPLGSGLRSCHWKNQESLREEVVTESTSLLVL